MARPELISRHAFGAYPGALVSTITYTDTSSYLLGFTTRRGRNTERDTVEAGTATPRFDNRDRQFDPTYTGSPYWPDVLPMVPQQLVAEWATVEYPLHTGYVERWPIRWETPMFGTVEPTSTDAMAALAQASISGSFPQETTGARITRVLAAINWPASPEPGTTPWVLGTSQLGTTTILGVTVPNSEIDTGQATVQAVTITADQPVSALEHIQLMTLTEVGAFFIDGRGYAIFHDRARRYLSSPVLTLSDQAGDGDVWYEDLQPDFDVARVVNHASVTTTFGETAVTAEATDDASRERYFRRSRTLNLPLTTAADLESRASYETSLYAQPRLRIERVTVRPEAQPSLWPDLLSLDISDRVTLRKNPTDGITSEVIVQESFVEAVEHTVTPTDWTVTLALSPADAWAGAWILGTSTLGVDTMLVY